MPASALLITLDTTRRDVLTPYRAPAAVTPRLNRLAQESVVYDYAYTVAPLTTPAHASMLTGLYPPRHGVRLNGSQALPDEAVTVAELAADSGRDTAAFVASAVLHRGFGLAQGFDVYQSPQRSAEQRADAYAEWTGDQVVAKAVDWLQGRDSSRPFFLWVHLWDPHAPYQPPARFADKIRGNAYAAEVAAADDAVGVLLDSLEDLQLLQRCTVVVVSDHGEAFGEHGERSHAAFCYDTTMRVPFLLRSPPGGATPRRSTEVVTVADVAPTLMTALDLPVPSTLDGRSLLREPSSAERGVYFESYYGYSSFGWSPLVGWVDAVGKYLHSSEPAWYENRKDPGEQNDGYHDGDGPWNAARRRIEEVFELPALRPTAPGASLREDVAALGYAVAETEVDLPHPLAPTSRPSPRSRVGEQARMQQAFELVASGMWSAAEGAYREIIAQNPQNVSATQRLAVCLMRQGRHDEAVGWLTPLVTKNSPAEISYLLGVCHLQSGRSEAALEALQACVQEDPGHSAARKALAEALRQSGREKEAAAEEAKIRETER